MFTAARDIAKKPRIFEIVKVLPEFPAKPAIIAPTIITDDIAFVTDINGVCKDGVTLQTTQYPIKIDKMNILNLNMKGSISMVLFN